MLIGLSLGSQGWIANEDDGMPEKPISDVYITSLYWVVTTLTTVGYGDITGHSSEEYLFTMVVEVRFEFIKSYSVYWYRLLCLDYGKHQQHTR